MKTNSPNGNKSHSKENIIFGRVDRYLINKLAKFSGFIGRKDGKIKPYNLILGFMIMTSKKLKSFDSWAGEIASISGISLSKQAVEERMNCKTENMLKLVFEAKLSSVLKSKLSEKDDEIAGKFLEIFIEDSTVIPLPANLAEYFPGNVSRGEKKSQAKIHALHNLTKNNFSFLDIHSFTNNDQALAPKALSHLKPGQLILRDLGFHVLSVFKEFIAREIYFISRKKFSTKVYDEKTGKQMNLLKLLRKKKCFDGEVLIGSTEKIKVRLVIVPIPEKQAEKRRRKERKNRDRRINHSLEYYELLGYTILMTNVPVETCKRKEITQLYSLRWRIEIIFKTWKSHFSFEEIMPSECKNPLFQNWPFSYREPIKYKSALFL